MRASERLGLFVDEKGLLRCHGRLDNAELRQDTATPKLLPKDQRYTRLLIEECHFRAMHAGVSQTLARTRREYWIPQGRRVVQKVLKLCLVCKRYQGGPFKMPTMPQLPPARVTITAPFQNTGIDFFGPLYIKRGKEVVKVWVCLFTCLVVRAVHLELVEDMTTESFLMWLRRLIARRANRS